MSEDIAIAQIVTAITSVFYAGVFVIGYYLIIKGNRETLREMREQRIEFPRIIRGETEKDLLVSKLIEHYCPIKEGFNGR